MFVHEAEEIPELEFKILDLLQTGRKFTLRELTAELFTKSASDEHLIVRSGQPNIHRDVAHALVVLRDSGKISGRENSLGQILI